MLCRKSYWPFAVIPYVIHLFSLPAHRIHSPIINLYVLPYPHIHSLSFCIIPSNYYLLHMKPPKDVVE
jgi:hypothetical protein